VAQPHQHSFKRQLPFDVTISVANLAATLSPDSPYYVSEINPNGSMDQGAPINFLAALDNPDHPYLGLTGWNGPTTVAGGKNPDWAVQVGGRGPVAASSFLSTTSSKRPL
jgi:hypothetical protein